LEKLKKKKINFKSILKFFLPYGVVFLLKKYKLYKNKNNGEKEYVFDIIFSVGVACRPAYYLNKHELRYYSNPLDWMMSYSLSTVLYLYKSKFKHFFDVYVQDEERNHWFTDCKNNITSIHYKDIGNNQEIFKEIMVERFKKINRKLIKANKICFICNRNESNEVYFDFLKQMGSIYSGEITLINIKNNLDIDGVLVPIKCIEKKVSEKLNLIEFEFNDTHANGSDEEKNPDFWLGNIQMWNLIVGEIGIKMSFLAYLLKSKFE
jgi:hypothetical protein